MPRHSWIPVVCCVILSSCGAAVGVGSSGVDSLASTRIRTTSSSAVNRAVLEVFKGQGFEVYSKSSQSITFSKAGGRSADIAWSTTANPNPVMIRPTVSWSSSGGVTLVTCEVEVAQQSTVFGETVRQPLLVGKSAYNRLLGDVKGKVEAGR